MTMLATARKSPLPTSPVDATGLLTGTRTRYSSTAITASNINTVLPYLTACLYYNTLNRMTTSGYGEGSALGDNRSRYDENVTYDCMGNVETLQRKGLGGKIDDTKNTYSFTDKIESSTSEISSDQNAPFVYTVKNSYNPQNDDLSEVSLAMKCGDITSGEKKISYDYDQLGRLKNVTRLAGEDYTDQLSYEYDIHSWIKKIDTNFFVEELHYADGPGKALFSGNISSLSWKNTQNNTPGKGYLFTYDELNRLTKAAYGENNFNSNMGYFNEEVGYDENGNIESLHRNGLQQTGKYGTIDDLRMTYDGNKLSSVVECAPSVLYANSLDLKSGSDEIAYNGNGSLIMDGTRGITAIKYDRNNNPQRIQFNNGNVTEYIYTATGQKLRTIHYSAAPDTHVNMGEQYTDIDKNHLSVDSTDYLMNGNLILENGKADKMLFGDGYIQASYSRGICLMRPIKTKDMSEEEYRKLLQYWLSAMSASRKINGLAFYYFNKDHLGNVREVVDTEGLIHQTNDYYPFGTPFSNSQSDVSFQKYKYNGKELDMMHGLNTYDYGARQYDAILPSWDRIDPLAETNYNISPYVYCGDNPINAFDPDGCADFWFNGKVIGNDGANDNKIYVLKTTETIFESGRDQVAGAGLSKKELNATVDFINANSGNTEAFQNNGIAYTNSIGIEESKDNRQVMVNEVSKDNGRGGTTDANNREYGGTISNGVATVEKSGEVANPSINSEASISLTYGADISRFHSHPSGTVVEGSSNITGAVSSLGGQTITHSFNQFPSSPDVRNAGNTVNYVFGRGDGKVYVYTSSGVQAVIPINRFVTPKR